MTLRRRTFCQAAALTVIPWKGLARSGASDRVMSMVEIFISQPFAEGLQVIAQQYRAGGSVQDVFAAIFLAAVKEIRPRHVGGKLHAVMIAEPLSEMASQQDRLGQWTLAAWHLDDLKEGMRRDRSDGDWSLSDVGPESEEPFRLEQFHEAMRAWDDEAADRAMIAMVRALPPVQVVDQLWTYAAQSYANIGHKMIFLTQTQRMMQRMAWREVMPVFRSLTHGLLFREGSRGPRLETAALSRELAAKLIDTPFTDGHDREASLVLLGQLREASSEMAQNTVFAELRRGVSARVIWDAFTLMAAEVVANRPQIRSSASREALLPVHAITVVEAFEYAFRTHSVHDLRCFFILQAAGWLPLLRDDLNRFIGLEVNAHFHSWITAEVKSGAPAPRDPRSGFEALQTGRASVAYPELAKRLTLCGVEHHQHKYLVATAQLAQRIEPSLLPLLWCPVFGYLPDEASRQTNLVTEIHQTLKS